MKTLSLLKSNNKRFLHGKGIRNNCLRNFTTVEFVNEFKTKTNICFIKKEELQKSDDFDSFKRKYPFNYEEFIKTGRTLIHKSVNLRTDQVITKEEQTFTASNVDSSNSTGNDYYKKVIIIDSDKNKNQITKLISETVSGLMTSNSGVVQVTFSNKVHDMHHRAFIINQIISSNYLFRKNATEIKRETYRNIYNPTELSEVRVFEDEMFKRYKAKEIFQKGILLAEARNFTRKLSNTRANIADCDFMEKQAWEIVTDKEIDFSSKDQTFLNANTEIEIIKGEDLLKENMNLFYSVGKAATTQPRLVLLKYKGNPISDKFSHCILGKGLIYDTGGLNLKPTGYMEDMFLDKHGACNSLAIFKYLKQNGLNLNVICAIAVAENSIDSKSYKPSDIIKSRKGFTVEIGNTDAEGRLCLVDAITYIQDKYKPNVLIDIATLTGACMVALGEDIAGAFTNSNSLLKDLKESSEEVNEQIWELPIKREHRAAVTSRFADLTNSSSSDRFGGASQAAAFIEAFVEKETKWLHLDIAGPSGKSSCGTGFSTQTVLNYLLHESQKVGNTEVNEVPLENIFVEGKNPVLNLLI